MKIDESQRQSLKIYENLRKVKTIYQYLWKSIEEVKSLNYELFQEIGLDENKINYVSRVIYSTYKKAQYMASSGASPQKAVSLDNEADEMLLKVLSPAELKKFNSIKHKLK